jgi:hypothetical protein
MSAVSRSRVASSVLRQRFMQFGDRGGVVEEKGELGTELEPMPVDI